MLRRSMISVCAFAFAGLVVLAEDCMAQPTGRAAPIRPVGQPRQLQPAAAPARTPARPVTPPRPAVAPPVPAPAAPPPSTLPLSVQDDIGRIARALEAANTNPNSAAEEQRAADTLKAQQDIAAWTRLIYIAASIGAAMAVAGVALAGFALATARKAIGTAATALQETRKVGEAQIRAYLAIEAVTIAVRRDSNCFKVTFAARNLGNSPADNFNYCVLLHVRRVPLAGENLPAKTYSRENVPQFPNFPKNRDARIRSNGTDHVEHSILDFKLIDEDLEYLTEGSLWVSISIATRFKDVFGNDFSDVEHFYRLGGIPLDGTAVDMPSSFRGWHTLVGSA